MDEFSDKQLGLVLSELYARQNGDHQGLSELSESDKALMAICEKRLSILEKETDIPAILKALSRQQSLNTKLDIGDKIDLLLIIFMMETPGHARKDFFKFSNQFYPFFSDLSEVLRSFQSHQLQLGTSQK